MTVRQAIRMAINSDELVDKVLLGYGSAGDSIVPPVTVPGARWVPEGEDKLAWDIPAASELLEDAGYVDSDGDGVREMPPGSLEPGRPLEFRDYVRTNEQTSVDAAPFVSEWLGQIGIGTEVIAVTTGRLGDIVNEGTYDMYSWGWYPGVDPDAVLSWMTCDQRPPDGVTFGNDDSYYCNPEFDRMYLEQQQALVVEDRWNIVHEMQKIFYEDAAYSVMWYDPQFQAYRTDRFTGYNPQPPPNGDLLEGFGGIGSIVAHARARERGERDLHRGSRHLAARVGRDRGGRGGRRGRTPLETAARRARGRLEEHEEVRCKEGAIRNIGRSCASLRRKGEPARP